MIATTVHASPAMDCFPARAIDTFATGAMDDPLVQIIHAQSVPTSPGRAMNYFQRESLQDSLQNPLIRAVGKNVAIDDRPMAEATVTVAADAPALSSSTPDTAGQFRASLSSLSTELISLILERLRDLDSTAVTALRVLSRRFDALATPVAYHTLLLNARLLAPSAPLRIPTVFRHITAFTNHVVVRSHLDPEAVARLINTIHRLYSIRWCYVNPSFRNGHGLSALHSLLNSATRPTNWPRLRLHLENLPLLCDDRDDTDTDAYLQAVPSENLVSLTLASPAPPLTARLGLLKRLLLQSPRIETFHYQGCGQGTSFRFTDQDGRLPPFVDLSLRSYDWDHSADEVDRHWKLSRLRSLELVSVPIFNFLDSVPMSSLVGLQSLRVEDFSAHRSDLAHRRLDATARLSLLLRYYVYSMRRLRVTCQLDSMNLDAVLIHDRSLLELSLRDHTGFDQDDRPCPTLSVAQVATLAAELRHVRVLELDLDFTTCDDVPGFLAAVARFRSLHSLTLHTQTAVRPLERMEPGADPDRDASAAILDTLVRARGERPGWRRITVNVGGWRPRGMVRRFTAAWKRQHAVGVFAERCFILENGRMREEKSRGEAVTGAAGPSTPDRGDYGIRYNTYPDEDIDADGETDVERLGSVLPYKEEDDEEEGECP